MRMRCRRAWWFRGVRRSSGSRASAVFGVTSVALGWGMVRGRHAFADRGGRRPREGLAARARGLHARAGVGRPRRRVRRRSRARRRLRARRARSAPTWWSRPAISSTSTPACVGALALRLAGVGARDGAYAILGNHDHYAGPGRGREPPRRHEACGYSATSRAASAAATAAASRCSASTTSRAAPVAPPASTGPTCTLRLSGLDARRPAHPPRAPAAVLRRVRRAASPCSSAATRTAGRSTPASGLPISFMEYVAGRYERDGSTLWVNRGFGVAGPPSRVGAPPEVTKIVLIGA